MSKEEFGTMLSVSGGASAALWFLGWSLTHWLPFAWLLGGSVVILLIGLLILTAVYSD